MYTCIKVLKIRILLQNRSFIKNKIVEELQSIFGNDNRSPTSKDLNEMHYLEMVIKETLRLHAAGPFISRLIDEDISFGRLHKFFKYSSLNIPDTLGDIFIPKGVSVMMFLYGMHRDPTYFPDPEKFDPSRFETNGIPKAYFPFGAGPRNCIGTKHVVITKLFRASLTQCF